ncbi:MAG: hypothetical protein V1870_05555 [Candidatus Aenigmatarchaeota archaeon]
MNINKTDIKILELCSRTYRSLSCIEIAKTTKLHKTTVNQRLDILTKKEYLLKKGNRTALYHYNFSGNAARKFRLFIDSEAVAEFGNKKINEFIEEQRTNKNIELCILYGSILTTKNFNDIDMLIVYKDRKIENRDLDLDLFQIDIKSFRELYTLGEPRFQAALVNGRILIDREFIFKFFENNLPIPASDDIMEMVAKKHTHAIKTLGTIKKEPLETLKKMYLNALETKAIMVFLKNKTAVPAKTRFISEIRKIDKALANKIENVEKAKTPKEFWDIFYE